MDKVGNICDRRTSKGRRLIILHAITKDGPLITRDVEGKPIETLKWTPDGAKETDTPHHIDADGEKGTLTTELLWVASIPQRGLSRQHDVGHVPALGQE
eukprot:COSAG02_NODE_286_length_25649_cov_13.411272_4_plen_99_part_00